MTNTVFGLFAGVGGIEIGFQRAGFTPILANELDKNALVTYKANHAHPVIEGDIKDIVPADLPDFDILVGGFPCQPFSVSGKRQGFNDHKGRGNVFWNILAIADEKKPEVIVLENVKNLVTHDDGNTFRTIRGALESIGYHLQWKVLNSKDYGNIPQSRERIFIVAFRDAEKLQKFSWPEPVALTTKLEDLIDFDSKLDDRYYYTQEKNPKAWDALSTGVIEKGVIYQLRRVYVRANKSGVSPTLTANMGTGGHNVPLILTTHGIRKLTPRECFNLMGYDESLTLPVSLSHSALYKQAGNSVVVPVVEAVARSVREALEA